MTHLDQEAVAALRAAQLTVINATWHLCEEQAVERLAHVRGLACTPLFPGHPVIRVVTCDGRLLGRVRRHRDGRTARWIAVPAGTARGIGAYRTAHGAARALSRDAGMPRHRVTDRPAPATASGHQTNPQPPPGKRRP
ncbi:hypothetical protein ACIHCX_07260 [Streptomyces sp. NPDC052043]|uniref:hypothetical protein n=1 Tax=Streptomyces sp. NPDC052043 TaxID=3365684 RepID=UPI0037CE04F8